MGKLTSSLSEAFAGSIAVLCSDKERVRALIVTREIWAHQRTAKKLVILARSCAGNVLQLAQKAPCQLSGEGLATNAFVLKKWVCKTTSAPKTSTCQLGPSNRGRVLVVQPERSLAFLKKPSTSPKTETGRNWAVKLLAKEAASLDAASEFTRAIARRRSREKVTRAVVPPFLDPDQMRSTPETLQELGL